MGIHRIQLNETWLSHLEAEFHQPYMVQLRKNLVESATNTGFFPESKHLFRALNETPLPRVKVVILGHIKQKDWLFRCRGAFLSPPP